MPEDIRKFVEDPGNLDYLKFAYATCQERKAKQEKEEILNKLG